VPEDDSRLSASGLPEPDEDERQHSERLVALIRSEIETGGGSIPFSRFMDLALYAPGLGYYSAGTRKFGAGGDFVTAPELGALFAQCIARQCAQLRNGNAGDVLEFGPGTGALAVELLKELEQLDALPRRYVLLETSADLRARQQERLQQAVPRLMDRVDWLDQLPQRFNGTVIANEVLDAMPVELFRTSASDVLQRGVSWSDGALAWNDVPAPNELAQRVAALQLAPNYVSEINFTAEAWIATLAAALETGALILIDYGFPQHEYYHAQRSGGTLMCHYRHRAHDNPLVRVGLQDITAHVNFTAMAQAAVDAGLDVLGYTSQAAFLLGCGLDELLSRSDPEDARAHLTLTTEAKKLTLPSEMGELFKVMALGRGVDTPLRGFALDDRRGRL
jgi:SAM-dependent MidA family methyltransferase